MIFFTTIYCFDFFLIPSQTFAHFLSKSLFSWTESSKIKYLFQFFSSIYPLAWLIGKYKGFTLNIFTITNSFNCNVSNIVSISAFVMFFVDFFYKADSKYLKIVSSVFYLYLFEFSHLSSLNCSLSAGTKRNTNNIFFQVPIKIKKIAINSSVNCSSYWE